MMPYARRIQFLRGTNQRMNGTRRPRSTGLANTLCLFIGLVVVRNGCHTYVLLTISVYFSKKTVIRLQMWVMRRHFVL